MTSFIPWYQFDKIVDEFGGKRLVNPHYHF
jgi:hypothetical protein